MNLKRGDVVTIEATVDALRLGLNSRQEIRVRVGDAIAWIPCPQEYLPVDKPTMETKEADIAEVKMYIAEEMEKRLIPAPLTDQLTLDLPQ